MNNAVKFTYEGGHVALDADIKDDDYVITVEDNGKGIPASKIEDVLNPFSRVENDPYTTQEGTGLGLAIVKSLMVLHDGSIEIESEYGKGTKVILTFPKNKKILTIITRNHNILIWSIYFLAFFFSH